MNKGRLMRICVHLVLVALYLIFFGYSSIRKFLERSTFVIHEKIPTVGIEAPDITFCPRHKKMKAG